jgi:hypothetical protein
MMIKRGKKKREAVAPGSATPAVEWENRSKYDLHTAEIRNAEAELEHRRELKRIGARGKATIGVDRAKIGAQADADIRVRGHDSRVTSLDLSEMTDTHIPAFLEHLGPRQFEAKIGSAAIKVGPGARSASETADASAAMPRQFDGLITPLDPAAIEEEDMRLGPARLASATADFERLGPPSAGAPAATELTAKIRKEAKKGKTVADTIAAETAPKPTEY